MRLHVNTFYIAVSRALREPAHVGDQPVAELRSEISFGPEQVTVLLHAYEEARKKLRLVTKDDPLSEALARKIIEVGAWGVADDPDLICEQALMELRADALFLGQR